jgi:lipoprotein-anchoring transpeptidase ErfK/SrfK
MHSTLRASATVLAAGLIAVTIAGCGATGQSTAKPVALAGSPSTALAVVATSSPAAVPITVPVTTPPATTPPPTTPPAAPSTRAAPPPASSSNGGNSASLAAEGVPCQATAVACVSLSKQEAWLLHDGKVVFGPVRVATGRASLPTPAGIFHVMYKVRDSWSVPYKSWMPWAVYFHDGDAFHEDPVTVRSHGCVHLSASNAEYFYNYLQVGNEVQIAA